MQVNINLSDLFLGICGVSLALNGWFLRDLWKRIEVLLEFREKQLVINKERDVKMGILMEDYNDRVAERRHS